MSKLFFVKSFTRNIYFGLPKNKIIFSRYYGILTRNKFIKALIIPSSGLTSATLCFSLFTKTSNAEMELVQKADDLYNKNMFKELLALLEVHNNSNNADVLWRLARAMYEEAKVTKGKNEIKSLYQESLLLLKRAEEINSENFAVHKWIAIITDCYYSLEGTKARIQHLFEMKTHMEKACELNPTDGTSWHVLALWYFGIADISWYERKAAAIFFATPPSASYEDALNLFIKAEKVEPNFYSKNLLMISKCLIKLGRKDEAKEYLTRTVSYCIQTSDDQEAKDEAEKLLRTL